MASLCRLLTCWTTTGWTSWNAGINCCCTATGGGGGGAEMTMNFCCRCRSHVLILHQRVCSNVCHLAQRVSRATSAVDHVLSGWAWYD